MGIQSQHTKKKKSNKMGTWGKWGGDDMAPCGKGPPHAHVRSWDLRKGGQGRDISVPLFHTPTVCPDTDTFQAHREDLLQG